MNIEEHKSSQRFRCGEDNVNQDQIDHDSWAWFQALELQARTDFAGLDFTRYRLVSIF